MSDSGVHTARSCLADLKRGIEAVIGGVHGDDALAQRLRAAGLWPGVVVERLASAPFGGPLLFRLHGYRLALRREEAQRVALQGGSAPGSSATDPAAGASAEGARS